VAHDGLARAVRPAHTPFDGDTIFALSAPSSLREDRGHGASADARPAPVDDALLAVLGAVAVDLVAAAIVRAVLAAESLHGVPAARDWI
jgi:L-aminopeptidase/D-esterase-like protein